MGKSTARRTKKLRRRFKQQMNGHEVRHKLIAGRTGTVHKKKLDTLEDPYGRVKILVPGVNRK